MLQAQFISKKYCVIPDETCKQLSTNNLLKLQKIEWNWLFEPFYT